MAGGSRCWQKRPSFMTSYCSLIRAPLPHYPLLSLCFGVTHWTWLGLPEWAWVRGYLPEQDQCTSGVHCWGMWLLLSPPLKKKKVNPSLQNRLTKFQCVSSGVEDLVSKWKCVFLLICAFVLILFKLLQSSHLLVRVLLVEIMEHQGVSGDHRGSSRALYDL